MFVKKSKSDTSVQRRSATRGTELTTRARPAPRSAGRRASPGPASTPSSPTTTTAGTTLPTTASRSPSATWCPEPTTWSPAEFRNAVRSFKRNIQQKSQK